jgi:hypothetical protein
MRRGRFVTCAVLAALLPTLTILDASAQSLPAGPTLTLAPELSMGAYAAPPSAEAQQTPRLRRRSPALMITGITLTCLSGVAAVVGGSFLGLTASIPSGDGPGPLAGLSLGLGALAGGAVLAGVGVPLWVYGAKGVPSGEASLVPSVRFGNRSMALAWTF